jgi:hypothetical protein
LVWRHDDHAALIANNASLRTENAPQMIYKLLFFFGFVWFLLMLVQRQRLGMDLASLTLLLIVGVLALSFSPFWVEKLAQFFEFGTPSMAVVALAIAGLVTVTVILLVMISDLKRKHSELTRQVASLQLKLSELDKITIEQRISN